MIKSIIIISYILFFGFTFVNADIVYDELFEKTDTIDSDDSSIANDDSSIKSSSDQEYLTKNDFNSSQQVLPKGVWHSRFIFGNVSEVAHLFDHSSRLTSISRYNIDFDNDFLKKMDPRSEELIDALNKLYDGAGDKLHLGSLKFYGGPEVFYFAPVLAYGVTDRWTIGIGLPIVSMYGNVTTETEGINTASSILNDITPFTGGREGFKYKELIRNLGELTDLEEKFNQTLRERGYKPFDGSNFRGIGDLKIFSFYNYFNRSPWYFTLMTTINLPTGPKDDPDDLVDFPNFAQTGIELKTHHQFQVSNRFTLGSALSYYYIMPDRLVKRVPKDEDDILPEADRKEFLYRNLGDEISVETFGNFNAMNFLSFNVSLALFLKGSDYYLGDRLGYDYSLLSTNTKGQWVEGKVGVSFSSIPWFKAGKFPLPLMISYNYSDVLYGHNVHREVRHEASLLLFF